MNLAALGSINLNRTLRSVAAPYLYRYMRFSLGSSMLGKTFLLSLRIGKL